MISHSHFLSFYAVSIILPFIGCHLLTELGSLRTPYERLPQLQHGDDTDTVFLGNSLKDSKVEQQKGNRNIIKVAKARIGAIFKGRGKEKIVERNFVSWEVCYDIAQKASKSSQSGAVNDMAKAVLNLGPRPPTASNFWQSETDVAILMGKIHLVLENESVNTAERIWSAGVLSYLRSQLPGQAPVHYEIPGTWKAEDLVRSRGQFVLFFLQDKDLGKVAEEMWSELPPKLETSEYVIQEAIQRESIVHLIQEQRLANHDSSADFQKLYLAFINLETPIDSKKASSLMKLITKQLNHPNTPKNGFDKDANTVRLLLHLEEYQSHSYLQFRKLIDSQNIKDKILESDISFQLADQKLPQGLRRLLREFQDTKTINTQQIIRLLESLENEQMSIPQLGRYFRALNLVFNRSPGMSANFHFQLMYNYPEIVPKLFEMLTQRRYGQLDPESFKLDSLEYLIYIENDARVAKKYRHDLAKVLVSKEVLSESDIAQDSGNLHSLEKQRIITHMLYGIVKKVSEAKTFQKGDKETNDMLAEYILHLISFKTDDMNLYHYLSAYKQDPEQLPVRQTRAFEMLSHDTVQFVRSWNQKGDFEGALRGLEERILYMDFMLQDKYL